MPELPEVETVMRGLMPSMEGAVIAKAQINRPDLRWPFPERMSERLTGQRVERLRRRSKYILADLASGETLLIHLGMSGRMLVSGDPCGSGHGQWCPHHLQRSATVRGDGSVGHGHGRGQQAAGGSGA